MRIATRIGLAILIMGGLGIAANAVGVAGLWRVQSSTVRLEESVSKGLEALGTVGTVRSLQALRQALLNTSLDADARTTVETEVTGLVAALRGVAAQDQALATWLNSAEDLVADSRRLRATGITDPPTLRNRLYQLEGEVTAWVERLGQAIATESTFAGPMTLAATQSGPWTAAWVGTPLADHSQRVTQGWQSLFAAATKINTFMTSEATNIMPQLKAVWNSEVLPARDHLRQVLAALRARSEPADQALLHMNRLQQEAAPTLDNLRWGDLLLDRIHPKTGAPSPICQIQQREGFTTKTYENRNVPISAEGLRFLQENKPAGARPDDFVLDPERHHRKRGGTKRVYRYDCVKLWARVLKRAMAQGNPKIEFKEMRHSFACNCLLKGHSVEKVARWLGHKDPRMVRQHYAFLLNYDEDTGLSFLGGSE